MNKPIFKYLKRFSLILMICAGAVYIVGLIDKSHSVAAEVSKENVLAKVAGSILREPIPYGRAQCWQLDRNSFAIKVPKSLMIFDYHNDRPAQQWSKWAKGSRKLPEKELRRSLLSGVIEPDEIKNENVVVFFSHAHPAELLPKALTWREKIENIYYILPEDIYKTYESDIARIRQEEMSEEKDAFKKKKDILDSIKIAKPSKTFTINGIIVKVLEPQYFINPRKKTKYPGVEFLIKTRNGVTIYHSGSFTCHKCMEEESSDTQFYTKAPKVISKDTKKLRFQDGRLVTIDEEQVDRVGEVDEIDRKHGRLGLALYSNPSIPETTIFVWHGVYDEEMIEAMTLKIKPHKYHLLLPGHLYYPAGTGDTGNLELMKEIMKDHPEKTRKKYENLKGNSSVITHLANMAENVSRYYSLNVREIGVNVFNYGLIESRNARLRGGIYFLTNSKTMTYFMGYSNSVGVPFPNNPEDLPTD
jgi:hypothetical protein